MTPRERDLLTIREAADYLQLAEKTVRAWVREGKLRGVKVGGRMWRVRQSDLDAMVGHEDGSDSRRSMKELEGALVALTQLGISTTQPETSPMYGQETELARILQPAQAEELAHFIRERVRTDGEG